MYTLFDVEEVQRIHWESEIREARKIAAAEGRAEGLEKGRAEGREEGLLEGREEGRAEGRAEGREEGRAEGAVHTCKALGFDFQKTCETIASMLDISYAAACERIQKYW